MKRRPSITTCTASPERTRKLYPNVFEAWLKVKDVLDSGKNVILCAPPKSGKRILVQLAATMSMKSCAGRTEQDSTHVFVTSLNKKDIRPQIEEMELYGIHPFMLRDEDDVDQLSKFVDDHALEGTVYVHFDESDYGTKVDQLFDGFFATRSSNPKIKIILYSATNFEAAYSDLNERAGKRGNFAEVSMEPGTGYRGAGWFLDENLVHNSDKFFDFSPSGVALTKQGRQCLAKLFKKDAKKGKIGVVRICCPKTFSELNERIAEVMNCVYASFGTNVDFKIVDQKNSYTWGPNGEWRPHVENGKNILIFPHQTCTRSTELGFHEYLAFWHEHRDPGSSNISTIAQSVLRVAHYHPKGHRIEIFTDKNSLEAYDGRTTPKIPLSSRISKQKKGISYDREFFSEDDVTMLDAKGLKTKDPRKAKTVRIKGKTVPKPYASAGSKDFSFARLSRQGTRGGKRSLLDPVVNGVPRSMRNPLVCLDRMGSDINRLAGFSTISGKDVVGEISSGKTVFYFAKPNHKPKPKTKKNSIYSRNP